MEITRHVIEDTLTVVVVGRLDAYWADHLSRALDDAVRDGAHQIRLDLAEVSYISSIGLRVLLSVYKRLREINGWLAIANPSDPVKLVMEVAGLSSLLAPTPDVVVEADVRRRARRIQHDDVVCDVFAIADDATLACHAVGDPEQLPAAAFLASSSMRFPDSAFGLGLGAFGQRFEECRARFGEFLAVAGTAAYLPTDGSNVPDCLISTGALAPEVQALYGLGCRGTFSHLLRFEAPPGARAVSLSTLAAVTLDTAGADTAGIVIVAESAGLVAAALRRSPAAGRPSATLFAHPQIRDWLSFTPERAHLHSTIIAAGVVARDSNGVLGPFLRSVRPNAALAGHVHAAVFPYRPLQKGDIDLHATVRALFDATPPQAVVHLLSDDRDIVGVGESEFMRGACWIGPIASVVQGAPA